MSKVTAIYELSPLQEGILFHDLYEKKPGDYILQLTCDLEDPDIYVLKRSWETLLQHHSILRTGFNYKDMSISVQCVYPEAVLPFSVVDLSNGDGRERSTDVFLREDKEKGFDLERPPLMRVTLLKLAEKKYKMVWTVHHIVCDGWSLPVLVTELLANYESLCDGEMIRFGEEDRYEDYIRFIRATDQYEQEVFWKQYFSAGELHSPLPFFARGI